MRADQCNAPHDILHAEDLSTGDYFTLGSFSISADEIIAFAQHWDPQFFHLDEQRAADEGYFGGLIASGIQTLAIYQRLMVDSLFNYWAVIGGTGIRDLQFRRPVRPGDTLSGTTVIDHIEQQPERGRARIDYSGELVNQHNERVLILTTSAYLRMRTQSC